MAYSLSSIGSSILRSFKPILGVPCFVVPSSVNIQVRHLKRKGYREKAERKKKKAKLEKVKNMKVSNLESRSNIQKVFRTVDRIKFPDVPSDDVFIEHKFKIPKYSLAEALKFHQEYHHPTVFNNPDAFIGVKIEFDMTAKKKTQFIKPFKGIAPVPHRIPTDKYKEILVFCEPEETQFAYECGASVAGGPEIVKKVQAGTIQPSVFDHVICTIGFINEVVPIRNILKLQMPKLKHGTVAVDLKSALERFIYGIEYQCFTSTVEENFGYLDCIIGSIKFTPDQVEENFKALLKDIEQFKPPREGDFITWVWCTSRPSSESFAIDTSLYLQTSKSKKDLDDDDDDETKTLSERQQIENLKLQLGK